MKKNQAKLKQELNRLRRQKSILWLGILFFVAVIVWTSFSIFSSQKKVKLDAELTDLAKPLIPRLSTELFSHIETKRHLNEAELTNFPIYVYWQNKSNEMGVLTNIMTATEAADIEAVQAEELDLAPISTESAPIESTETASDSGNLIPTN